MFDGEAFGKEMVEIVRGYVSAELKPLKAQNKALAEANVALTNRVAELEAREIPEAIKGEPGEVDVDALKALVDEAVAQIEFSQPEKGEKGEKGDPGEGCDMEAVRDMVGTAAKAAVDAIPAPKDGEPGRDGLGLANALIDASGNLVLTMTDGTTKSLGPVHGRDGAPGRDGETFTLDDFDIEALDERTIKLKFTKGEKCHSFELAFPVLIGRGVWSTEGDYERGDVVTWGGTAWEGVNPEKGVKPEQSNGGWRILAKRGRDGKDFGK